MGGRAGGRGPGGPRPPDRRQGGAPPPRPRDDGLVFPLPRTTREAWEAHRRNPRATQNPSLVFDRFAPDWGQEPPREREPWKKRGLHLVCEAADRADIRLLAGWNARWRAAAAAVGAATFTRTTDWRLITGLGAKGPLEVGFTFHRYGFPILPGSSLKGLARAAAFFALADELGEEDLVSLDGTLALDVDAAFAKRFHDRHAGAGPEARAWAETFRAVFGTTGRAGGAVFLDAIPLGVPKLEIDIMNPHYPEYYREQGDAPPADWQSPIPVYFLAIGEGTTFSFAVGWRARQDDDARRLRGQARAWLEQGLTELGAGAKTSAGYGYFAPSAASPDTSEAAPASAVRPSPTADAEPPEPVLEWRMGTVREYNAQRQRGRLRDDETGDEWSYTLTELADRGRTPGKGQRVRFALGGREGERRVVRVERLS
jgi:CRISPR-associated protein Cmr6